MRTSVAGRQPARAADTVALRVRRLHLRAVALLAFLLAPAAATGAHAQQPPVPTPAPAQVRLHVVSRLPLIDPPRAHGEHVLARVRPGEVFALAFPHGRYVVRLMKDDGYAELARSAFAVVRR
jgi:hypothetical protein